VLINMDLEQQDRLAQLRNRKPAHPAYGGRIVAAGVSTTAFLLGMASLAASAKPATAPTESATVIVEMAEPELTAATEHSGAEVSSTAPLATSVTTTPAPATTPIATAAPATTLAPVAAPPTDVPLIQEQAPVEAPAEPEPEVPVDTEAPVVEATQARPRATNPPAPAPKPRPKPAPAPKPPCTGSKC
jgi:hypothetical protein